MSVISLRNIIRGPTASQDDTFTATTTKKRKSLIPSSLIKRILYSNLGAASLSTSPSLNDDDGESPENGPTCLPQNIPPSHARSVTCSSLSRSSMEVQLQSSPRPTSASSHEHLGYSSGPTPSPTMAPLPPTILIADLMADHKRHADSPSDLLFNNDILCPPTPRRLINRTESDMRLSPSLTLRRPHPFLFPTLPPVASSSTQVNPQQQPPDLQSVRRSVPPLYRTTGRPSVGSVEGEEVAGSDDDGEDEEGFASPRASSPAEDEDNDIDSDNTSSEHHPSGGIDSVSMCFPPSSSTLRDVAGDQSRTREPAAWVPSRLSIPEEFLIGGLDVGGFGVAIKGVNSIGARTPRAGDVDRGQHDYFSSCSFSSSPFHNHSGAGSSVASNTPRPSDFVNHTSRMNDRDSSAGAAAEKYAAGISPPLGHGARARLMPGLSRHASKSMVTLGSHRIPDVRPDTVAEADLKEELHRAPHKNVAATAATATIGTADSASARKNVPATAATVKRRRSMPDLPLAPPMYRTLFPARPRDDEGKEKLPAYSCEVHVEGWLNRKMEFSAPGIQARDRGWKKLFFVLNGTSLRVYKHDPRKVLFKCPIRQGMKGAGAGAYDLTIEQGRIETEYDVELTARHVHFPAEATSPEAQQMLREIELSRSIARTQNQQVLIQRHIEEEHQRRLAMQERERAAARRRTGSATGSSSQMSSTTGSGSGRLRLDGDEASSRSSGSSAIASASSPASLPTSLELAPSAGFGYSLGPNFDKPNTSELLSVANAIASPFTSSVPLPQPSSSSSASSTRTPHTRVSSFSSSSGSRQVRQCSGGGFSSHFKPSNMLLKVYSLQNAESGLGSDYLKRRNVMRVRAGGEQFLLQANSMMEVVNWVEAFQAATNVALDLDERPMPKLPPLPRRRRRRRRPADGEVTEQASGA